MFMKFLEIKTDIKDSESFNLSESDRNKMIKFFSKFEFTDYKDAQGGHNFFCVIHDNYIDGLFNLFREFSIQFTCKDLTKDILFGLLPKEEELIFDTEEEKNQYVSMVENFIVDNLNIDTVLDKILEYGNSSLTTRDISILERA